MTPIEWQENNLFAPFKRDLVRRRRRPGLYPRTPAAMADALEQLCGGATVAIPAPPMSSFDVVEDEEPASPFEECAPAEQPAGPELCRQTGAERRRGFQGIGASLCASKRTAS